MGKRSTGENPLAYMGVEATTPPQLLEKRISPRVNDSDFDVGTVWLNTLLDAVWMLTNLNGGVATWTRLDIADISIVTDSGTATQDDGVIDILGQGVLSTSGATNVVTISLDQGADGQLLVGATSAEAAWANVTSSGGTISITEGANTINLEVVGGVTGSTQFDTDSGTAMVAGNTITIAGGTNVNTAGAGSTVTVNLDASISVTDLDASGAVTFSGVSEGVVQADGAGILSGTAGNNGQLLIGATGAAPSWASLASSGGTIIITEGANTINLESSAGLTSPYVFESGTIDESGGDVYFGNGNWVVCSYTAASPTDRFRYSTDLITWNVVNDGGAIFSIDLLSVHYGSDGYWVAVGVDTGSASGRNGFYTTDPTGAWVQLVLNPFQADYWSVNHNGTHWVATTDGQINWATDPSVAWTLVSTGLTGELYGTAYGNSTWVVVGESGFIATQATVPTGAWTPRTSTFGTSDVNAIVYSSTLSLFCAVGNSGKIATSPDGITWTQRSNIFSEGSPVEDVVWDATKLVFVAISSNTTIGISSDGINWFQDYKGFSTMRGIGAGNTDIVIVGETNKVKTSTV